MSSAHLLLPDAGLIRKWAEAITEDILGDDEKPPKGAISGALWRAGTRGRCFMTWVDDNDPRTFRCETFLRRYQKKIDSVSNSSLSRLIPFSQNSYSFHLNGRTAVCWRVIEDRLWSWTIFLHNMVLLGFHLKRILVKQVLNTAAISKLTKSDRL